MKFKIHQNEQDRRFYQTYKRRHILVKENSSLGGGILDGETVPNTREHSIKTLNRHGLIAGATEPEKPKPFKFLSEQLSQKWNSVFDDGYKGDFSGIAMHGERNRLSPNVMLKFQFHTKRKLSCVELMTISEQNGVRLRATVSELDLFYSLEF